MEWPVFEEEAARHDAGDPLRAFRDRFSLPPGRIYLDGNSLGLLSHDAEEALLSALASWRAFAIEGWTEADPPWFSLAESLTARVGALIGAEAGAIAVTGSTTVNLHQLLATFFDPDDPRGTRIVADDLNFPSDIFAIESHLRLRGLDPAIHLVKVASRDGRTLDEEDIARAFALPGVQMAVLSSVIYTSGQLLDLPALTREARRYGVRIGWDLSHSIGALPHTLDEWDADFAFWCHYKYLNAGPGAVGGLYLNRRHWDRTPGMAGWWGSDKARQFEMTHAFRPAKGAGALQIGTPHLLSLTPLDGALRLHEEAGIERIRAKSLALTSFLRRITEATLARHGVSIATPAEDSRRGGHIALIHPDASRLSRALRGVGVVPDFRPPNILRLAPVALYTSFHDCVEAIRRLHHLLESGTIPTANSPPSPVT